MPIPKRLALTIQMAGEIWTTVSNWCKAMRSCSQTTRWLSRWIVPSSPIEGLTAIAPPRQTSSAAASRRTTRATLSPWDRGTRKTRKECSIRRWRFLSISRTVCRTKSSHSARFPPTSNRWKRHTRGLTTTLRESQSRRSASYLSSRCWRASRWPSSWTTRKSCYQSYARSCSSTTSSSKSIRSAISAWTSHLRKYSTRSTKMWWKKCFKRSATILTSLPNARPIWGSCRCMNASRCLDFQGSWRPGAQPRLSNPLPRREFTCRARRRRPGHRWWVEAPGGSAQSIIKEVVS